MKKLLIFITAVIIAVMCMILSKTSVSALEDSQKYIDAANKLNNLGIMKGTGQGFELDRTMNKVEASVLIIRLMQRESIALKMNIPVSFKDVPAWSKPYVGYACNTGLISAVNPLEFGAADIVNTDEFTSMVLKTLGYNELTGDFKHGFALDKAREIGLLSDSELESIKEGLALKRTNAVLIAYNALKTCIKDSDTALISKFIEEGSIGRDRVTLITDNGKVEDFIAYKASTKVPAANSNMIAFLGDSHTEGIFFVDKFPRRNTLNKGLNGFTTRKILNRINEVVDEKPKKVFLMAGTNDIWTGETVETAVKNYALMLEIIKERVPNCKIYIQSTFPFGEAALKRNSKASNEKVENLNKQLVLLADKYGAEYLDIGSLYRDNQGNLDSRYTQDGIHIKLECYGLWLDIIKKHMD